MRNYILLLCLCLTAFLSACFDDDSTVATDATRVHKIDIEGLQDTSAVAFSTVLELTPEVKGFAEGDLSFAWYIYGGQFGEDHEYRKHRIGEEKTLVYPVELKIGHYTVICEATHRESGYFGLKEFELNVSSAFSNGFYALKETAEGNTELDFYNYREKETINDLLITVHGAPLAGKPRNMNAVYAKMYIDPATAESTYATGMFVANGENDFVLYNTIDMSVMFDRNSLFFGTMEADEIPYAMGTAAMSNFYFSNKGVASDNLGGGFFSSPYATGKLTSPMGSGASAFVQAYNGSALSYWSETEHILMRTDGREIEYEEGYTGIKMNWDKSTVVASGWNHTSGSNVIWYLFDVEEEGRYLVFIEKGSISEVRLLDAGLSLAKASVIAGNGKQASFIYSVRDNRIYRYSMPEETESPVSAPALPEGTITYVSHLFYSYTFDYLVIGVQSGEKYTVVMYEIKAGVPLGEPKHTFSGTGILKKVCYATTTSDGFEPNSLVFSYPDISSPTFPY